MMASSFLLFLSFLISYQVSALIHSSLLRKAPRVTTDNYEKSSSSLIQQNMIAQSALLLPSKAIVAVPLMYSLMSLNEYITHRYYQHAEFNKNQFMQKIACMIMNVDKVRS